MAPWLLAGYIAAFAADVTTTHLALQHGAREAVIAQNPWITDAVLATGGAGSVWSLHKLRKRGHPKLATGLAIAAIGVHGWAAIHNYQEIQKWR